MESYCCKERLKQLFLQPNIRIKESGSNFPARMPHSNKRAEKFKQRGDLHPLGVEPLHFCY